MIKKNFIINISAAIGIICILWAAFSKDEEVSVEHVMVKSPSEVGEIYRDERGDPYVRVATLEGEEAVRMVKKYLDQWSSLNGRAMAVQRQMSVETDPGKVRALTTEYNNMTKAMGEIAKVAKEKYGIPLERGYLMINEKSTLYIKN
jgi:hypothetical protein